MPRLITSATAMTKVPSFRATGSTANYTQLSPVTFDTVVFDNMGGYDTTNKRYYAQLSGKYLISVNMGIIRYAASENGYPWLRKNGTNIYYAYVAQDATGDNANSYASICMSIIVDMAYGDYVDLSFNQGNADYYQNTSELQFCGQWIAPLD